MAVRLDDPTVLFDLVFRLRVGEIFAADVAFPIGAVAFVRAGGRRGGDRMQMPIAVRAGAGDGDVRPRGEHLQVFVIRSGAADRGNAKRDAFADGRRIARDVPRIRAVSNILAGCTGRVGGKIAAACFRAAKRAVDGAVMELIGIAAVFSACERHGVVCVLPDIVG